LAVPPRKVILPLGFAALVAPLAGVAVLGLAGWLEPAAVLGSKTVGVFAGLAAIVAAACAGTRFASRRLHSSAAWLIAAMSAGEGAALWVTRVSATLDVGVGEEGAAWAVERAAIAGGLPDVKLLELPATRSASARLLVDGREIALRVGRPASAGLGRQLVVRDLVMAPAFTVSKANGSVEGAGLIKLVPGRRDWFEVGLLPHRFYVTLTRDPGDAVDLTPPIHVRVQRGKLSVHEGDLGVGEATRVEGISIAFERGAPWARLEVRSRPTGLGAAAAVAVAGLFYAIQRRRIRGRP
jgi:hypothetical protein